MTAILSKKHNNNADSQLFNQPPRRPRADIFAMPRLPNLERPIAAQIALALRVPLRAPTERTQFLKRVPLPRLPANGLLGPPRRFLTFSLLLFYCCTCTSQRLRRCEESLTTPA